MMDRFLQQHFTHIGVLSVIGFVVYAFLHYELLFHSRDLIYWHCLLRSCFSELARYKYAYTFITFIVSMNLLLIFTTFTRRVHGSTWLDEEKREDELKQRYQNFLFIRLLSSVDKIEKRYLTGTTTTTTTASGTEGGSSGGAGLCVSNNGSGIPFENLVRARNEIWTAIVDFRKDAHKLFKLNESEIWLPIEDVYCLLDDEENEVQRTKYFKSKVKIDCATLAALVYD